MRSQFDAIVTSTATVKEDDPLLTSKGLGKNPVRIVMGSSEIPVDSKILNADAETLVIKSREPKDLITLANDHGFNQLMIECGPTFGTSLLSNELIDEIVLFQAPSFLGSGTSAIGDLGISNISGRLDFEITDVEIIGADLKITLIKSAKPIESGR
jgi:diaminohydroxyphosphoribosylaminopyrimidine deaminase/5-amino-6-(5-phosphoribosylamino)uracil reductase